MTETLIFETESWGGRTIRVLRNNVDGDITVAIVDDPPILNEKGEPVDYDFVLSAEDADLLAEAVCPTGRRAAYELVARDLETLLREGCPSVEETQAARVVAGMLRRSIDTGIAED